MLEYIITSKTRRKILKLFFENIGASFHLRRIGREVSEEINAVKRELDILTDGKVLTKEKRLNKVIFTLSDNYLFYEEFLRIFVKEGEFVQKFLKNLPRLGKIKYMAISMRFAKKLKIQTGGVYILIVGMVVLPEIVEIIASEEKKLETEINYTVMTEDEFVFRKKNNDPFIWSFLKQPKIMIVGNEEALIK